MAIIAGIVIDKYTEKWLLCLLAMISDKKNKEDNWVEGLALSDAMNRLNDRENHIVKLRFFEGKTQMEIADEILFITNLIHHIECITTIRIDRVIKTDRTYQRRNRLCPRCHSKSGQSL